MSEVRFEKFKVLLIEDKLEARVMIRNMLKDIGITQVFEAANGREGLDFIDSAADLVDIVLCDWNMPKMTGMSLLRQLRTVDPDTPFVMVTGRGDMDSVVEAKGAGINGYILKPFSKNQLEAKLRIVIQQAGDYGGNPMIA